jgi:D,D-heptose 1,7-bisphosphate phosphatase
MSGRKAVFLDLQGTLGGGGLGDILNFAFFPFAAPAIRLLNDVDLLTIVITNQTHISRGNFTYDEFETRIGELKQELAGHGAKLDGVYCCPHIPADNCSCRKPAPGMVLQAQRDFDLDLSGCYLIGDRGDADMVLARAVGCKAVLVRTGLGEGSLGQYRDWWADIEPDFVAQDVLDAVKWIIAMEEL